MDFTYLLDEHLEFIRYLYDGSAAAFAETKRKIEANEEPYVDMRSYEEIDGEPAFLSEWLDADDAIDMMGVTCLSMTVSALQMFLKEFVRENWGESGVTAVAQAANGKGWFGKYKSFFDGASFQWELSGADLEFLEQMILVRNDDQHSRRLLPNPLSQGKEHAQKYPNSAFKDRRPAMEIFGLIHVPPELLARAGDEVRKLCKFLDDVLLEESK